MIEGLVLLAALGVLFVMIFRGTEQSKQRRLVASTKRWTVATLPDVTIGRLDGIAKRRDRTVEAPVSGKPCLFYCVRVVHHERGLSSQQQPGRGSDDLEAGVEQGGAEFNLDDGTGVATIDPELARAELSMQRLELPAPDLRSEVQRALYDRYRSTPLGALDSLRFFEGIVEDGDSVAVVGFGERGEQLRMQSSPNFPLVIARRTLGR